MVDAAATGSAFDCASFVDWQDAVCQTFVDLRCRTSYPGVFRGKLDCRKLLDVDFVRVAAVPHSVERDARRIAASCEDVYLLSIVTRGQMVLIQNDRVAKLGPRDFAIYDTRQPYKIILDQEFSQTVVRLHSNAIESRLANAAALTARKISGDAGMGQLASRFLRQLPRQLDTIAPISARPLKDSLLDLIAAAYRESDGGSMPCAREGQHLLMRRVLHYVEENLHDESISCESIARALGISGRYLRKVFEQQDHSLSEWIWHRRLQEGHRLLSSQQCANRSITAISYDLGFKDSAHFSKAFKAKYGHTPKDFRQGH